VQKKKQREAAELAEKREKLDANKKQAGKGPGKRGRSELRSKDD
jgi:hypothetical protein